MCRRAFYVPNVIRTVMCKYSINAYLRDSDFISPLEFTKVFEINQFLVLVIHQSQE